MPMVASNFATSIPHVFWAAASGRLLTLRRHMLAPGRFNCGANVTVASAFDKRFLLSMLNTPCNGRASTCLMSASNVPRGREPDRRSSNTAMDSPWRRGSTSQLLKQRRSGPWLASRIFVRKSHAARLQRPVRLRILNCRSAATAPFDLPGTDRKHCTLYRCKYGWDGRADSCRASLRRQASVALHQILRRGAQERGLAPCASKIQRMACRVC